MIPVNPTASIRAAQAEADRVRAFEEAEEEAMTPYSAHDLASGWEFKIIRSPRKLFGRPEFRERILAEERRAGWVLVEVFDHTRIRLKRSRSAIHLELIEGYDPYRTVLEDWREPRTPAEMAAGRVALAGLLVLGVIIAVAVAIIK